MSPNPHIANNNVVVEFKKRINKYVCELFNDYKPKKINDRKVIHEAIHGSNVFFKHEIAIIDSPLLQRLRRIHQNGLAYLTYPTSIHTRFDHTIGVTSVIDKYTDAINQNLESNQKKLRIKKDPFSGDYVNLRMAALLHDCGHSFFSHTSEKLYENDNVLKILKEYDNPKLNGRQAHEILSYYIVKSNFFKKWFKEHITGVKINLDTVANMIIGTHINPEKQFLAEMINSHIDADKMDYIQRDGLFSGLKLICDSDRLFKTIKIRSYEHETIRKNHIVLNTFIPMEQIIASKRCLFVTVYHHQKVRACEAMIVSICEYIKSMRNSNIILNHPVDFLYYDDYKFMITLKKENDPFIKSLYNGILSRNLYKRAFSICKSTVENWDSANYSFNDLTNSSDYRDEIRKYIWEDIPSNIKNKYSLLKENIQLSFPKIDEWRKDETLGSFIIDRASGELKELFNYVPVNEWVNSFANHKYRGYVFCPCFEDLRKSVFNSSKKVFEQQAKLNINDEYCKNDIRLYC